MIVYTDILNNNAYWNLSFTFQRKNKNGPQAMKLTLNVRGPSYLGQYHGCWYPGSLRRQVISNHDIDYVK